jgi:hypothetical protein
MTLYALLPKSLMEMVAPGTVTRMLGMEGHEGLVRAYGAREIGAGMLSLSTERSLGLWSRVAGDALDIGTVVAVAGGNERKRGVVGLTLAVLAGVAAIDLLAAQAVTAKHSPGAGSPRSYRDRTGYPQHAAQRVIGGSERRPVVKSLRPVNPTARYGSQKQAPGTASSNSREEPLEPKDH